MVIEMTTQKERFRMCLFKRRVCNLVKDCCEHPSLERAKKVFNIIPACDRIGVKNITLNQITMWWTLQDELEKKGIYMAGFFEAYENISMKWAKIFIEEDMDKRIKKIVAHYPTNI